MNCLNPVGDDDSIIMCKFRGMPKLLKLFETIKIGHKLCKNCIKITPSNCKICKIQQRNSTRKSATMNFSRKY